MNGESIPSASRPLWPYLVLIALSVPVIFYNLGSYSIVTGDEAFYHYASRNMVEKGDWMHLELNGQRLLYPTLMNGPLTYWVRAALIAVFGDSGWTMRGLSAFFGLLTVLATYRLAAHLSSPAAGFLAGLFQLTTYQFIYMHSARTGEHEPILCFLFVAIAYTFVRALESGRSFVAHHAILVLLLNVKWPLVLIVLLAEVTYFGTRREIWPRFRSYAVSGALIVPWGFAWHAWHYFQLRGETTAILGRMGREASGQEFLSHLGANAVFYVRMMVFGAFPYSLVYPFALVGWVLARHDPRRWKDLKLLGCYPLAVFLFFSFVQKNLAWYIMPVYAFFSTMLAVWLHDAMRSRRYVWLTTCAAVVFAASALLRVVHYNPFELRFVKYVFPVTKWRELPGVPPLMALVLLAALGAVALLAVRRFDPARYPRYLSLGIVALLVGIAAHRVVLPLQHTDYVSRIEAKKRELDATLAAGEAIRFPVRLPEQHWLIARYYFGDDYMIARPGGKLTFVLLGHGSTPGPPPRVDTPEEHARWARERKQRY